MFNAEGIVLTAKVETTVDGSREYGRVVLLAHDGRDTAIITGSADFAREMEQQQGTAVCLPIKLSADRQGGVRTTHDKARWEAAKAAARRSEPPTEGAHGDGDAPPESAGRKAGAR